MHSRGGVRGRREKATTSSGERSRARDSAERRQQTHSAVHLLQDVPQRRGRRQDLPPLRATSDDEGGNSEVERMLENLVVAHPNCLCIDTAVIIAHWHNIVLLCTRIPRCCTMD